VGCEVFRATVGGPNGQSVRERRSILADTIDKVACGIKGARILSLACGHLREAEHAKVIKTASFDTFVAMDQDRQSIKVVQREKASLKITPVVGSVASLIRGKEALEEFDLIYAAGLFDYLSDGIATKLIEKMYGMLSHNGIVIIANFTPNSHGRGYMEAFMDWNLIYRDEDELRTLTRGISARGATVATRRDTFGNVAYLEVCRS
jgi:hypothetical protein